MPIYSPVGYLDITNATLRTSNLEAQNFRLNGGNIYVTSELTTDELLNLDNVVNAGNTTSNTVQFTNSTTGFIVDSNIVVAGNVTAAFLHGDASNVTAVPAAQITGTLAVANGGTGTTTSTGTGSVVLSDAPTFTGDVTFDTNTLFVDSANDRVGIGTTTPDETLSIYREDTTAAGQTKISSITGVFSGSDVISGGNINNTGLYINLDSSATGGTATTSEEHRIWGIDVDIDVTGDSDDIRGGRFLVRSELAANGTDRNTNIFGIDAQGQHNGSAPITNIMGVTARTVKNTSSTGLTDTMTGVNAEYEINAGTCTDAFGVRSRFDRNGGAVTNSYLFYGEHLGSTTTITNNYGLYVTGADRHYLEGNVGVGTDTPVYKLDVNGEIQLRGQGLLYHANETSDSDTSRYFLQFNKTLDASYPMLCNRTPNGDVVIATGTSSGGGDVERMRFNGGDGTRDIEVTNANFIVSGTLSAGTIEASNISGTVGDTSGVKAVYFGNTENDGAHYTDKSGILAFDENFYPDTDYGTGTYDPSSTFVGNNGGGLLIKNEDGWGAIFTSQNTRWAKGYWNSLDVSGGVEVGGDLTVSGTVSGTTIQGDIDGSQVTTGTITRPIDTTALTLNVGRGDVYFENNVNDDGNDDGAGITIRTSDNPVLDSMFAVRSSGQASRFWVGQSLTSVGANNLCAGYGGSNGGEGVLSSYNFIVKANGDTGIGTTTPGSELDVNGTVTCTTLTETSDDRIKYNEQGVSNALTLISQLNPQKYEKIMERPNPHEGTWIPTDEEWENVKEDYKYGDEFGFIAQDVRNIPELAFLVHGEETRSDTKTSAPEEYSNLTAEEQSTYTLSYVYESNIITQAEYSNLTLEEQETCVTQYTKQIETQTPLALNYQGLFVVAIGAIKELKSKNDALEARISALESV